MNRQDQMLVDAWLVASADLGIQITAPFRVTTPTGEGVPYLLLVHSFGSPLGTLLCTTDDDWEDAAAIAEMAGYYSSALNPIHYSTYDRADFIETLTDWGWRVSQPPPPWYTRQ